LQQSQAALPAAGDNHSWWHKLWHRNGRWKRERHGLAACGFVGNASFPQTCSPPYLSISRGFSYKKVLQRHVTAVFLQSGIRPLNAKTFAGGDYSKRAVHCGQESKRENKKGELLNVSLG
jgi:hypothetical protein